MLNGGYNYDYTTFTEFLFIDKSQPIISRSGAGWEASLFDGPTGRGNLIVYAYCFDNSPWKEVILKPQSFFIYF